MLYILYFSIGFVVSIITYVCAKLYDMYDRKYLCRQPNYQQSDVEQGMITISVAMIFLWPAGLLTLIGCGFYYVLNLLTQKLFSTLETLLKKDK